MSVLPLSRVDIDVDRRASFRALFDREFDYVLVSLRRLGVHPRDLEDVAQEVFIQVSRRFGAYDASRPARPWLFAFAVRCAADWRRLARHRVEPRDVASTAQAVTPCADVVVERAEDAALVMRALECVPMERRAVLILYEFDECSMKEIAESLGIPLFTAYSRMRTAREEFTAAVRRLRLRGER